MSGGGLWVACRGYKGVMVAVAGVVVAKMGRRKAGTRRAEK
jgi:hypothetical protein